MKNIVVIGSSNIDFVISVKDLPVPGETVLGRCVLNYPGGKGANQAVACGLLGGNTSFVTVLGNSKENDLLQSMFAKAALDISTIKYVPEVHTGAAYINVDEKGQNTIIVIPGSNEYCTKEFIQQRKSSIEAADIVLIQLEIPFETVSYVVEYAKGLGKTVILNPAPISGNAFHSLFGFVDYLTPNETELQAITGMPVSTLQEIETAARTLLKTGIKAVVVTIGKRGAMLVTNDGSAVFSPPSIEVVDTTAAGDTFNGAIAVGLSEGKTIEQSIEFANHASTITVSRKGAQSSIPTREEVENFMKERAV